MLESKRREGYIVPYGDTRECNDGPVANCSTHHEADASSLCGVDSCHPTTPINETMPAASLL
jgi:hypothetical protein